MIAPNTLLALVTDAFGGKGGIAQYNRDLFNASVESGSVSSILVIPRLAPNHADTPTPIRQTVPRSGRAAYVVGAMRRAMSNPIDTVFCGHIFMAPLAMLIARLKGAKLIMQMHGIEGWQRPSPLTRKAVETADLVICVSRHTRAAVLKWAVIAPERVIVLPNTIGDAFTPGDGAALRTELGLAGKRILLTVARMAASERYKGHDRVIAAMPQLIALGHDLAYVIVGEGDDRKRLEDLVSAAALTNRVRFLGALEPRQLVDAYRMADLFVMPSSGEGFGIAFLEAMASGTPALGLGVAGARDALADGELGTCLSDETELVAAITRLLAQPKPDASALAAAVRARFGHDTFCSNVKAAFQKLLGPPSNSADLIAE
ncbi:MAG: glycosyltransferase family 4 protein [Pseudolabrys sp.]